MKTCAACVAKAKELGGRVKDYGDQVEFFFPDGWSYEHCHSLIGSDWDDLWSRIEGLTRDELERCDEDAVPLILGPVAGRA